MFNPLYKSRFLCAVSSISTCFIGTVNAETLLLPVVVVSAQAPISSLMDSGVHASDHTVNTLTQEMFERFQPTKIEEMVTYLPNVQADRLGAGIGEDFMVRGFNLGGRLLLNGILDNQNYYIRDAATIERVDIIKGHDSVLYGSGAPGGTINYITKKPQYQAQKKVSLGIGRFNKKRLVLDLTGPIHVNRNTHTNSRPNASVNFRTSPRPTTAYRSILVLQDGDTWKDNVADKSYNFSNSLLWQYAPASQLITSLELSYQANPLDFDNVYANGAPVYDVSYVHPDTTADRQFQRLSFNWQHTLNTTSHLEAKLNLITGTRDERQIGFWYLDTRRDTLPLVGYYRELDESFEQLTLRLAYHKAYQIEGAEQELTVGYGRNMTDTQYQNKRATNQFSLDIYQPNFNISLPQAADLSEREGHIKWFDQSIFVQNISHISQNLELRVGLRKNQFDLDVQRNDVTTGETEQENLSKSFGLRWLAYKNLEFYASYSDSFLPNSGLNKEGRSFDPQIGVQKEIGWTYKPDAQAFKLNMAVFDITQSNLLIRDPLDSAYKILAGTKQVTGVELQAQLALTPQLKVTINAGVLDPRIKKSTNGATDGNLFPSVPQETGSIMLEYQARPNLSLNMGAVYQGKRAGDLGNSFYVKGYTRYDLATRWQIEPNMHLNLSVQNLTDVSYVTYATAQDFVRLGNPRQWNLTLTRLF